MYGVGGGGGDFEVPRNFQTFSAYYYLDLREQAGT